MPFGSEGDISQCNRHVRFGSKADIGTAKRHVRFTPNSDGKSGLPQNVMSALSPKADTANLRRMEFWERTG